MLRPLSAKAYEADIAWLRLDGWRQERAVSEEQQWGLIERDRETGGVIGFEYWKASERLPAELLDAPPAPPAREIVVERQPA